MLEMCAKSGNGGGRAGLMQRRRHVVVGKRRCNLTDSTTEVGVETRQGGGWKHHLHSTFAY